MSQILRDCDEHINQNSKVDLTTLQSQLLLQFYSLEYGRFLIDTNKTHEINEYLYRVALKGLVDFCNYMNTLKIPNTSPIFRKLDEDGYIMCARITKTYETKKSISFFLDEYKELAYDIEYLHDEKIINNLISGVS